MTIPSRSSCSRPKIAALCLLAALAGIVPFLGGCVVVAAGAAGAGAVAYVRGALETSVPHGLDRTYAATQRALNNMKFARIEEKKTAIDAELTYRTALDKKVHIELERVTDELTKVHIRVGLVGDQQLSLTILDQVNAELK
jgi:hypothetical protein